jgi:hypothetical protein
MWPPRRGYKSVVQKLAALVLTTIAGILLMDSIAVRRCITFYSPLLALLKLYYKLGNIIPLIPFLFILYERYIHLIRVSRIVTFTSSYNNYGFSIVNRAAIDKVII